MNKNIVNQSIISKKNLNILYIIPFYKPAIGYGGPIDIVSNLSSSLSNNNHNIIILTTNLGDGENLPSSGIEFEKKNIIIYRLKILSQFIGKKTYLIFSPTAPDWNKRFLKDIDVVHFHSYYSPLSLKLVKKIKKAKIPLIVSQYSSIGTFKQVSNLQKVFRLVFKFFFSYSRDVDIWTAVSNKEKYDLIKMGISEKKITIIPNRIVFKERRYQLNKNFSSNSLKILYFSRLHQIKRPDILIDAVLLLENNHLIDLKFAGEDFGEANKIKNKIRNSKIEKNVKFQLGMAGKKKNELLLNSELVIIPSPGYGSPLSVLDALAVGRPVLTSDITIGPLIEKHMCGYFIECNKFEYMKKIHEIMQNKSILIQMGKNCIKFVKNYYNFDLTVKNYENLYRNLKIKYSR